MDNGVPVVQVLLPSAPQDTGGVECPSWLIHGELPFGLIKIGLVYKWITVGWSPFGLPFNRGEKGTLPCKTWVVCLATPFRIFRMGSRRDSTHLPSVNTFPIPSLSQRRKPGENILAKPAPPVLPSDQHVLISGLCLSHHRSNRGLRSVFAAIYIAFVFVHLSYGCQGLPSKKPPNPRIDFSERGFLLGTFSGSLLGP